MAIFRPPAADDAAAAAAAVDDVTAAAVDGVTAAEAIVQRSVSTNLSDAFYYKLGLLIFRFRI
jgi:hypothetical protein